MIVYRFALSKFSQDISGEGARKYGGRWNKKGNAVVYTSVSISLSLLELLMHSVGYDEIKVNELMTIETNVDQLKELTASQLKQGWQEDIEYCRYIGDEFLESQSSLLMKVPSAIIPEEFNILVNPKHKDFGKVKIKGTRTFQFDARLFKSF
jgi:RES domain-containing protein